MPVAAAPPRGPRRPRRARGELLKVGDPLGDLCLLLRDELLHPFVGGAAVGAGPDREQRGDLLAAQPHPPRPGDEQQLAGRGIVVVAVPGRCPCRKGHQPGPLVVAHRRGGYPRRSGELRNAHTATVDLEPEVRSYVRRIDRNCRSPTEEDTMGTFTRANTELAVDVDGAARGTAPRRAK